MSDEELEVEFPISPMESMFLELHQEMLAAKNAGFTAAQSFTLIRDLFENRLNMVQFSSPHDWED